MITNVIVVHPAFSIRNPNAIFARVKTNRNTTQSEPRNEENQSQTHERARVGQIRWRQWNNCVCMTTERESACRPQLQFLSSAVQGEHTDPAVHSPFDWKLQPNVTQSGIVTTLQVHIRRRQQLFTLLIPGCSAQVE